MDTSAIASLISARLEQDLEELSANFLGSATVAIPTRSVVVDDLLPQELAKSIHQKFPSESDMRLLKSFRELKTVSNQFDSMNPLLRNVSEAFQDSRVVALISRITGLKDQEPDPSFYAGGLSSMSRGHFLNPHIDNSHDGNREKYRTLNLLYYVTPDWVTSSGGHLELWDANVKESKVLESRFNRLIVMETNQVSWHSVSPVQEDRSRKCVSNYFFSKTSPTGEEYFQVTSFSGRPEQPMRRAICALDTTARTLVRKVFPKGVVKDPRFNQKKGTSSE